MITSAAQSRQGRRLHSKLSSLSHSGDICHHSPSSTAHSGSGGTLLKNSWRRSRQSYSDIEAGPCLWTAGTTCPVSAKCRPWTGQMALPSPAMGSAPCNHVFICHDERPCPYDYMETRGHSVCEALPSAWLLMHQLLFFCHLPASQAQPFLTSHVAKIFISSGVLMERMGPGSGTTCGDIFYHVHFLFESLEKESRPGRSVEWSKGIFF